MTGYGSRGHGRLGPQTRYAFDVDETKAVTLTIGDRARAWLELSRGSNLPTVWSNVLHGMGAGHYVLIATHGGPEYVETMTRNPLWYLDQGFMLLVGMSFIYVAGMVLNDVFDAKDDAIHRPARPIPSGRVSRVRAGAVGALLLTTGVAVTAVYRCAAVPVLAGFLALCVLAYDLLHRVKLLGYLLMPLCRALVVMTAALAFGPTGGGLWLLHVGGAAAVLAIYTAAITLTAWAEHRGDPRRKQRTVAGMIAGMPLIDAAFLAWIGHWPLAAASVGCAVLTAIWQRRVPGT